MLFVRPWMVLKVSVFFFGIEKDYRNGLKVLRDTGREIKSYRKQDR